MLESARFIICFFIVSVSEFLLMSFNRSSDDEELQEAVESTYGHNVSKDLTLEEALVVVETLKRRSHENLIAAVEEEEKYGEEAMEDEDEEDDDDEGTILSEMLKCWMCGKTAKFLHVQQRLLMYWSSYCTIRDVEMLDVRENSKIPSCPTTFTYVLVVVL